ncbi:MAG: hypothetical protein JWO67_4014 [Streptosporangiaceae bacterium]|nr:hypothetical protein [Streptosporangiaceae bacterium]
MAAVQGPGDHGHAVVTLCRRQHVGCGTQDAGSRSDPPMSERVRSRPLKLQFEPDRVPDGAPVTVEYDTPVRGKHLQ